MQMSRVVKFTIPNLECGNVRYVDVEIHFDMVKAKPESLKVDGESWSVSCAGNTYREDR